MKYYKYKFYLYAFHSMNGMKENSHAHTFSIMLYIKETNQFTSYETVESLVNEFLKPYETSYLNETLFDNGKIATVEEIGELLHEKLEQILQKEGFELLRLDINETPLRTYSVLAKRATTFMMALIFSVFLSLAVGQNANAASNIVIDGKYQDWSGIPHGILTYGSWNGQANHQAALYRQGDHLYGHIKMHNIYGAQMQLSSMNIKVNGINVQFAAHFATSDGQIDWGKDGTIYNMPVGITTNGLAVFNTGWPVYKLGSAAFTVTNKKHSIGDEYEFEIDLKELSKITHIKPELVSSIELTAPNIGGGSIIINGTSSGPYLIVLIGVITVLAGFKLRKRNQI